MEVYATERPGGDSADVDMCTLELRVKYELIPTIVCSVCLSFGLIYCFFGAYPPHQLVCEAGHFDVNITFQCCFHTLNMFH